MPDGQLIEFDHVTKRFGAVAAVSDFSARVNPGVVTGFLGPNGAGKTTTLRMLVGLERPTIGTTKIGGKRFSELREPARVIGAMLENPGFRARRTVERHLIAAAKANSIPLSRVGELISFVGLGDDVETRIAALSLGMRQRLSAATALIGDPGVLVLDEPANGLDPEGIRWMRTLIRGLADEGRTVLVSSHVLSEVEQTADEILVIARGELKFAGTMEDLADPSSGPVVVDAADRPALSEALRGAGFEFEILRSGLTVRGSDAARIGAVTAGAGVALTTLQQRGPTLEDVFLDLVNDRYVRVEKPATNEPALFEMPHEDDEQLPLGSSAEPVSSPATSSPELEDQVADGPADADADADADAEEPEPDSEGDATGDATRMGEPAAGETRRSERAARVEASAKPGDEDRPLPGMAGLAAVASLFNTPSSRSAADEAAADGSDADEAESDPALESSSTDASEAADPEGVDLDATRVIDVVPGAEQTASDVAPGGAAADDVTIAGDEPAPSSEPGEDSDETDATDEFFDAFTGDPSSDDDDAPDLSSGEASEGGDSEPDAEDGDSHHDESTRERH
ncbi:ABC transporter ATP-binding protein [Microbacterium sp. KRD172]|uniref:ABC transporter ATP-binding protein n=1 Tax=Microbacterium sp. KRD172 TaxID=2729727 RepID=UPI0019CFE0BF|nr:ATP-binding cassette domain-containing protein [Microbacterium sp. KRD172]